MKNKNILLVVSIMLMISVFAIGCTPAERPVPETTPNQQNMNNNNRTTTDNTVPRSNDTTNNTTLDNNNMNTNDRMDQTNGTNGDLSTRADKIENAVTKLDEVNSATVVITENTALIGINMTSGTKGSLNTEIKKKVEDAVKNADKEIDRVSVTADPDLFTRIENVAEDIASGKPLSGFGQEIEEIIRRITPGA